jgi:glycosyltransferase involved in cell wall biosynthesis
MDKIVSSNFPDPSKEFYFLHAYSVSPNHGSEKGLGFLWAAELCKSYNLVIFCEQEFSRECFYGIEKLAESVCVIPTSIGKYARQIIWDQGNWFAYIILEMYHLLTLQKAIKFSIKSPPKYVHQLNLIGFRSPGYLCIFRLTGAKVIWGPVGGINCPPPGIYADYGKLTVFRQCIKNVLNVSSTLLPSVILWRVLASKIFINARPNLKIFRFFFRKAYIFPETFLKPSFAELARKDVKKNELTILIVGKCNYRKMQLPLLKVLNDISQNKIKSVCNKINFKFVGCDNNEIDYYVDNFDIHIDPHLFAVDCLKGDIEMVKDQISTADALLHLSIDEGTSHAVVEAISAGLPTICFNSGGHLYYILNKKLILNYPLSLSDFHSRIYRLVESILKNEITLSANQGHLSQFYPQQRIEEFIQRIY